MNLSAEWITGFVDGEGCFHVGISRHEGMSAGVQILPEFTLGGGDISSKSNEPRNPAARVSVTEEGSPVYAGWLFSLYQKAHPIQHERYGVILKDFRQR